MYSISPRLIANKVNSKGLYPVKLQIIIDRRKMIVSTGVKVLKEQWKDRVVNHEHADELNAIIRNKHSEIEKNILQIKLSEGSVSIQDLTRPKQRKIVDYYAQLIIDEMPKRAMGTIKGLECHLENLKRFDTTSTFNQVDGSWLRRYEAHLLKTQTSNTVHKSFARLKKVFNAAIADKVTDNYPFRKYDNPKYIAPDKIYLTEKEVMKFWDTMNKNPLSFNVETSGYYFLLGCFSGLRVSDWLRFDPRFIKGDRMTLRAKKNGQLVTMKMHTRLKKVVKEVLKRGPAVSEQKLREHIKMIAKLAKIDKDISTHSGRRTFGVLCATFGIRPEVTAELMGISKNVVMVYYRLAGATLDFEIRKFNRK